jgi:hypothetical protein
MMAKVKSQNKCRVVPMGMNMQTQQASPSKNFRRRATSTSKYMTVLGLLTVLYLFYLSFSMASYHADNAPLGQNHSSATDTTGHLTSTKPTEIKPAAKAAGENLPPVQMPPPVKEVPSIQEMVEDKAAESTREPQKAKYPSGWETLVISVTVSTSKNAIGIAGLQQQEHCIDPPPFGTKINIFVCLLPLFLSFVVNRR